MYKSYDIGDSILHELSQRLLVQMRLGQCVDELWHQLAEWSWDAVVRSLCSDTHRKAFWINVYNAGFLYLHKHKGIEKPVVFCRPLLCVGGYWFSLDDIEHGILRKHAIKWALGWVRHPWPAAHIRAVVLSQLDVRIHFALNCGARSCPPIRAYDVAQLDAQLDLAMHSFLRQHTRVDHQLRKVHTSRLLLWYHGDFGGIRKIKQLLARVCGCPELVSYRLRWDPYDWVEKG